jgi:hypothetical protein
MADKEATVPKICRSSSFELAQVTGTGPAPGMPGGPQRVYMSTTPSCDQDRATINQRRPEFEAQCTAATGWRPVKAR